MGDANFECGICNAPCHAALMHLGGYCSELHKRQLIEKDKEEKDALLKEGPDVAPDEFDLASFERYTLKIALHMISTLSDRVKAQWRKKNPLLLVPDELANEIKARVIRHIPLDYVSAMDAEGLARMFHDGTYMFKKKVPKEVIVNAMIKAHVFKRPPEQDDP